MEDVLRRLSVVESISTHCAGLGDPLFDGEMAFLQFRKIVELIAFASLIANKRVYAAEHPKFMQHWKAKKLFGLLDQLNPNFYPVALCPPERQSNGTFHFERIQDGFLTRNDCEFLYDKASEIIHTWNPFDPKPRLVDVMYSGPEWVGRIRRLLAWHFVELVDGSVWAVNASTSPVHVYPTAP